MFSRIYAVFFALLVLPIFAAAGVIPRQTGNCNTGSISCCNSVQSSDSTAVTSLAGLLGIVLPEITGLIGLSCSPLSILGAGGNSCSAQPVCCTGNTFSGLINLGCSPINLNL
ncbi:fungal hydrophobin [Pluteus cervinus]|uniref:Fungal hydrophobin n=1 Tax=Pluteus cervinus TaxID=181527 RepID=A0ACD3AY13_9AGAR|nr:fungal hydrophobin [Pluteus cervinus]